MHTLLDERDKVEIESQIQKISNNSIVSKKAGSSIVVYDSAGNKPRGLRVLGKTEQKTYSGKNLFRLTIEDGTVHHGVTFTVNSDRSIILNGTPTEDIYFNIGVALLEGGVEYTISGCPVFDSWDKAGFYVNSDAYSGDVWNRTKESTFAMPDTKEYNCTIQLKKDLVLTNVTFYPMIRLASITDSTYEPYVGGIASPNPEYPQELVSVGVDGNVEVGLYGGNLIELKSDKIVTYEGLNSTINNDGSVTINGTPTREFAHCYNESLNLPIGEYYFTSNKITNMPYVQIQLKYLDGTVKYALNGSFSIDDTIGRVTLMIQADENTNTINNYTLYPILSVGSKPISYEPYKSKQSLVITTPNGLPGVKVSDASIATYTDETGQMWCADEMDYERGVYIQRVCKFVITYSSTDVIRENTSTTYGTTKYYFRISVRDSSLEGMMTKAFSNVLSDRYILKDQKYEAQNAEEIYFSAYGHSDNLEFRFTFPISYAKEECIDMVDGTIVYYPLETPIETPLSEEEIAQYKALTMNHPTTTILNYSNAHMEVEYVANTQNHIEQNYLTKDEFESLKTRISSIANNII